MEKGGNSTVLPSRIYSQLSTFSSLMVSAREKMVTQAASTFLLLLLLLLYNYRNLVRLSLSLTCSNYAFTPTPTPPTYRRANSIGLHAPPTLSQSSAYVSNGGYKHSLIKMMIMMMICCPEIDIRNNSLSLLIKN